MLTVVLTQKHHGEQVSYFLHGIYNMRDIILECVRNVEGVYAQVDHQRKATDDERKFIGVPTFISSSRSYTGFN